MAKHEQPQEFVLTAYAIRNTAHAQISSCSARIVQLSCCRGRYLFWTGFIAFPALWASVGIALSWRAACQISGLISAATCGDRRSPSVTDGGNKDGSAHH